MDEYNDLSTNNTATSFNNSPNGTATSDETSAAGIFDVDHQTSYAKSHRKGKALAVAALSLTVVTGVLNGNSSINPFIKKLPTISDVVVEYKQETSVLAYAFTVANSTSYTVNFTVTIAEKDVFTLDATKSDTYKGEVKDLGSNVDGSWSIVATNGLDYLQSLKSGTFSTKPIINS